MPEKYHWLYLHFGKWSRKLGVEATEDSCFVNDRSWVCRSDKSLQETDMTEGFFKELGKEQEALSLHNDSQSKIDLANNPAYHDRTKHIDV